MSNNDDIYKIISLVLMCMLFTTIIIFATILLLKKNQQTAFREEAMSIETTVETTQETTDPVVHYEYTTEQTTVYQEPVTEAPTYQQIYSSSNQAFYGIWIGAFKNWSNAQNMLNSATSYGFNAQMFQTTDWSNLNSDFYYVIAAGTYSTKADANYMLSTVQAYYPNAYVKYSGYWQG